MYQSFNMYMCVHLVDTLPANQALSGTRSCVTCPLGTWSDSSKTSCVPCGVSDCTVCTPSLIYGGVCFSTPLSTASPTFSFYDRHYASSKQLCTVSIISNTCYTDPCSYTVNRMGTRLLVNYY